MLATLSLLALASAAVAAPVVQRAVAEVTGNTTSSVAWYLQNGNAGACGNYSSDADVVVGLPLEFYNTTGVVSPYCGSYVILTNLANNMSVTALVQDASATPDLLSLSVATWRAVDGDNSKFTKASWRFANSTEHAAAYAAAQSSAPVVESTSTYQEPSSSTAAATTSTYVKPSATYVAAKVQATTEPSSTYEEPSSTWTPEPSSTWTPEPTTSWTPEPTTTWTPTTTAYVAPTKAASSGSYSGTATWFTQNGVAGNCGNVNSDSAYIIALETSMYSNGAHCGKSVTIWGNGGSIQATVADSCPSCVSSGSIDLSVSAFQALDSLSAGVFPVTWSFN